MPDVFAGWSPTTRHIRSSGTSKLLVKVNGDTAYYALGASRDVVCLVSTLGKEDSRLRLQGWGEKVDLNIPSLQASKTEIQILPILLLNDPMAIAVSELDGAWMKDDGTKIGLRWTLEYGGRSEDFRILRYLIMGYLFQDEVQTFFSNTAPTLGTPGSADQLFTLAQTNVRANQVPNGLTKFEFKAATDAAFATFGSMEDCKVSFTCDGPMDGGARQIPRSIVIKVKITINGLQTSLTEKQFISTIRENDIVVKMTHADGVVFTGNPKNLSTVATYRNAGKADKWPQLDMEIGGSFTKKADGSDFVDEDNASWSSMWV